MVSSLLVFASSVRRALLLIYARVAPDALSKDTRRRIVEIKSAFHVSTLADMDTAHAFLDRTSYEVSTASIGGHTPHQVLLFEKCVTLLRSLDAHLSARREIVVTQCLQELQELFPAPVSAGDDDLMVFQVSHMWQERTPCIRYLVPAVSVASHGNFVVLKTSRKVHAAMCHVVELVRTIPAADSQSGKRLYVYRARIGPAVLAPSPEKLVEALELWGYDSDSVYLSLGDAIAAVELL